MSKLSQRSFLKQSFLQLRSKRSSFGVDGVTVHAYADQLTANLHVLSAKLRSSSFRFSQLRPVAIPKGAGKFRPILVPTVEDRVVQRALLLSIAPQIEPLIEFEHSYAFRKGRGVKDAVRALRRELANKDQWVLVVDIKSFFPSVNEQSLLDQLYALLPDASISPMIAQLFQWEIEGLPQLPEAKRRCFPDAGRGLPQGSLLSPMLANLFLSPFDREMHASGMKLIRYADDLAVVCASQQDAEAALEVMRTHLCGLGLTLPLLGEPKCRVWNYAERGVEYLGCYLSSPRGRLRVKPTREKVQGALNTISDLCDVRRTEPLASRYAAMSSFVTGWLAAYAQLCDVDGERAKLLDHAQGKLTELLKARGLVTSSDSLSTDQRKFLSLDDLFRPTPAAPMRKRRERKVPSA